jgi:hypothetical protein
MSTLKEEMKKGALSPEYAMDRFVEKEYPWYKAADLG